jgi:hypothetical protein
MEGGVGVPPFHVQIYPNLSKFTRKAGWGCPRFTGTNLYLNGGEKVFSRRMIVLISYKFALERGLDVGVARGEEV